MDLKIENDNERFKSRANAIIINNDKVLLCTINDIGFLCCPGGHIHFHEDSKTAVIRETKEEVEIEFDDAKPVSFVENFYTGKHDKLYHEYSFYYLMIGNIPLEKQQDFSFVENDEGKIVNLEFKWIPLDEIDKFNVKPKYLQMMLKNRNFEFCHSIIKEY